MTRISTSGRKHLLLASSALAIAFAPALAYAQAQAPAEAVPEEAAEEGETIVVTGSLITNPNLERSSPVNVTTSDEIELKQSNVAEEILREIPGIVPNVGSATNNGNAGNSFVDLRGLGTNRNIVLLDGVRLTPADLFGRFDLNNIPVSLVERVDVLTGAASTTYGADAIAGVVNFITKQDFAGAEINASEQITERGDGNIFRLDATIGANFDDGRGNAVFSIGYQEADPIYQGGRDFSIFSLESLDVNAGGGSPTSTPSNFSVPGFGEQQINAAGQLVAPFATFNFNPFNIFQTPFSRYNMYGAARYEISDAIELYTRGLFSKNVVQTIVAPSGIFNQLVSIPVSNPFLPVAARNTFCANNDFDGDPTNGVQTLTPAECTAAAAATDPTDPNYRTFSTQVRRRTTEVGPRISDFQTQFFDYRLGLRGAITDTINWDVFGAYGESQNIQTLQNYVSVTRARDALLATNMTTCLSGNAGCVPLNVFGPPGSITPAQAAYLQVQSTSTNRFSRAQARATINGDLGFSSPWAEQPIGFAIGGEYRKDQASQNSDLLAQTPGELGGSGGGAPNVDGGFDVYEGFAELVAPLVEDKPFFESLTLEAGVRYSSYKVFAPSAPSFKTTTYKVGGSWEPGAGLKVRGNYSRAVRAPNVAELFAPVNTGLTNLGNDPCAGVAPTLNAELRAVCIAQGAPAFTIGFITQPAAAQANATAGGNINLRPEKSDSYTIGAVFQPDFVPGLSVSVDYYNIKIDGAVSTPTPGDLIFNCFGATPTAPPAGASSDPDCLVIRRSPQTGTLDGDPADTPGLFAVLSNLGALKTDGVDVSVNYRGDLGFAKLNLSFNGNYTHELRFKATPTALDRQCVGYYSTNCGSPGDPTGLGSIQPKFQFSQRTTLSFDDIDVSLLWRYIDSVELEPQVLADQFAAADADPAGCPDPRGADPGGCVFDPQFRNIKAAHYFDLSTRIGVTENVTVTLLVENLFDKKPPIVGNTIGSTTFNSGNTYPSTYDALGRSFSVGARLRF